MGGGGLTIQWSTGLINQTVAFDDAVGEGGLAPGHVDRGGGQLAEVDEAGSTGSCDTQRSERGGGEAQPNTPVELKGLPTGRRLIPKPRTKVATTGLVRVD